MLLSARRLARLLSLVQGSSGSSSSAGAHLAPSAIGHPITTYNRTRGYASAQGSEREPNPDEEVYLPHRDSSLSAGDLERPVSSPSSLSSATPSSSPLDPTPSTPPPPPPLLQPTSDSSLTSPSIKDGSRRGRPPPLAVSRAAFAPDEDPQPPPTLQPPLPFETSDSSLPPQSTATELNASTAVDLPVDPFDEMSSEEQDEALALERDGWLGSLEGEERAVMLEYRQMIEQHRKAESAERNKPRKEALLLAEKRREELERWKRDRLRPRLTGSVGWNRRQKALATQQAKWLGLPVIDPPSSYLAPPPPRSSASFRQPNPAPTPFQGPQRSLPSFLAAQEPAQPPKQATLSSPLPRPTEQPIELPVGRPVSQPASNKPAAVAPLPQHLFGLHLPLPHKPTSASPPLSASAASAPPAPPAPPAYLASPSLPFKSPFATELAALDSRPPPPVSSKPSPTPQAQTRPKRTAEVKADKSIKVVVRRAERTRLIAKSQSAKGQIVSPQQPSKSPRRVEPKRPRLFAARLPAASPLPPKTVPRFSAPTASEPPTKPVRAAPPPAMIKVLIPRRPVSASLSSNAAAVAGGPPAVAPSSSTPAPTDASPAGFNAAGPQAKPVNVVVAGSSSLERRTARSTARRHAAATSTLTMTGRPSFLEPDPATKAPPLPPKVGSAFSRPPLRLAPPTPAQKPTSMPQPNRAPEAKAVVTVAVRSRPVSDTNKVTKKSEPMAAKPNFLRDGPSGPSASAPAPPHLSPFRGLSPDPVPLPVVAAPVATEQASKAVAPLPDWMIAAAKGVDELPSAVTVDGSDANVTLEDSSTVVPVEIAERPNFLSDINLRQRARTEPASDTAPSPPPSLTNVIPSPTFLSAPPPPSSTPVPPLASSSKPTIVRKVFSARARPSFITSVMPSTKAKRIPRPSAPHTVVAAQPSVLAPPPPPSIPPPPPSLPPTPPPRSSLLPNPIASSSSTSRPTSTPRSKSPPRSPSPPPDWTVSVSTPSRPSFLSASPSSTSEPTPATPSTSDSSPARAKPKPRPKTDRLPAGPLSATRPSRESSIASTSSAPLKEPRVQSSARERLAKRGERNLVKAAGSDSKKAAKSPSENEARQTDVVVDKSEILQALGLSPPSPTTPRPPASTNAFRRPVADTGAIAAMAEELRKAVLDLTPSSSAATTPPPSTAAPSQPRSPPPSTKSSFSQVRPRPQAVPFHPPPLPSWAPPRPSQGSKGRPPPGPPPSPPPIRNPFAGWS